MHAKQNKMIYGLYYNDTASLTDRKFVGKLTINYIWYAVMLDIWILAIKDVFGRK